MGKAWLGAAVVVLAHAGCAGCTRETTLAELEPTLPSEERVALDAILARAGVDASTLPARRALVDFSWRRAASYGQRKLGRQGEDSLGRGTWDLRNAVAVEGGHVVALRLAGTRIDDLGLFAPLTHLVVLDLHDAAIARIQGLVGLHALDSLDLSGNGLRRIEGLDDVPALTTLALADEKIARIEGLDHVPALEVLDLSGNRVARIEGLDHVPRLTTLSLQRTAVARIEGLDVLPDLVDLDLSFCPVRRLDNLGTMPKLRYLNLWHDRVRTLDGLEDATPELVYIGLGENDCWLGDPHNVSLCDRYCDFRMIAFF